MWSRTNRIFSAKRKPAQISILCPDPYFYDASGSSTLFMDASAQFEFPFSNESVTEPMIEFSIIRIDSRAIINYEGDSDTGLIITLHPVATVSDITLYNVTTKESMAIDTDKIAAITGIAFAPGDDIIISTIKGDQVCAVAAKRILHQHHQRACQRRGLAPDHAGRQHL